MIRKIHIEKHATEHACDVKMCCSFPSTSKSGTKRRVVSAWHNTSLLREIFITLGKYSSEIELNALKQ